MILTLREMNECLTACKQRKMLPNLTKDLEGAIAMMLAQKPIMQSAEFPDDSSIVKSVKEIAGLYREYKQTDRHK